MSYWERPTDCIVLSLSKFQLLGDSPFLGAFAQPCLLWPMSCILPDGHRSVDPSVYGAINLIVRSVDRPSVFYNCASLTCKVQRLAKFSPTRKISKVHTVYRQITTKTSHFYKLESYLIYRYLISTISKYFQLTLIKLFSGVMTL